jgi:hypothetical protein
MAELLYGRGTRSAQEVQQEIDTFWAELETSGQLRKEVVDAGVDLGALPTEARSEAIQVTVRGAGLDPTMVSLVVAFAPIANEALVSLWKRVLLPRIRDRYGRDAVREEKTPES